MVCSLGFLGKGAKSIGPSLHAPYALFDPFPLETLKGNQTQQYVQRKALAFMNAYSKSVL